MGIWYTTRESVKDALDANDTPRADAQIDRAIETGSRSVDSLCRRRFYPEQATRYFDYPDWNAYTVGRVWLDQHDILSVSALVAGGVAQSALDYYLEPAASGPPYSHIDLNRGTNGSFPVGDTNQHNLAITGLWGFSDAQVPAGALAAGINSSVTAITVTDGSLVGVGSLLSIGTERLQVTERNWVTSGQTGTISQSNADRTLAVATGSAFTVGEMLLLNNELVLVIAIAGNTLTVKRAQGGSVLDAHSSATIYASRSLTVVRGASGSTAAAHLLADPVTAWQPEPLVQTLALAEAINQVQQERGAYARTVGSGAAAQPAAGAGIEGVRAQVRCAYARLRVRTV